MAEHQIVSFEFKTGHVGAVNLAVAEKMEKKGEGKILKRKPEPVADKSEKDEKK